MAQTAADVHVWCRATDALSGDDLRAADATLSDDERERCVRFVRPDDRRDFAAAHDLLRRALSTFENREPGEWAFAAGGHGKPMLDPLMGGLHFNLSHTRGFVACAVTRAAPVGIDVERLNRDVDLSRLAARFFSSAEIEDLGKSADARGHFFELWTLKEAFLKSTGDGMSRPLNSMSFDLRADRVHRLHHVRRVRLCRVGVRALCADACDETGRVRSKS